MNSTLKRRRRGSVGTYPDPNIIPRPGARSGEGSSTSISQTTSETSSMSRASSTKKQMMNLSQSDIVEWQSLRSSTVPTVAKKLFKTMEKFGRFRDFMPYNLQQMIAQKLEDRNRKEEFEEWGGCFRPEGAPDDLPGRIPSFEEIEKVLRKAVQIENRRHEEAGWNSHIHLPLLDSIFEDPLKGQCGAFNATICTTARLHQKFKPMVSTAKIIDLCVYASLDNDQELKAAAMDFTHSSPTLSINHTDFRPIQYDPLILSIETKKLDAETEDAKLQIGIWHAAQWTFLQWAVGKKLLQQGLCEPTTEKEYEEFEGQKLTVLSKLGFIPGIIVHGNRWLLILSTYNNGKTTIWSEFAFGTTESEMGIYAVVAGVRELTAWGRDTYMPWFKENILMLN
ncbi:hypothetical protein V8C37DRAFT_408714 [Trichoderma ceciliae]